MQIGMVAMPPPFDGHATINRRDGAEYSAIAEMITELIRLEPEICICNGNLFGIQKENLYL